MTTPRIVDAVFGAPARPRWRRAVPALVFAVGAHGALWAWAHRRPPSLETWSATLAARLHVELSRREVIELPPPSPAPAPPPSALPSTAVAPFRDRPRPRRLAAAPAQAARVVGTKAEATPLDLTKESFLVGRASHYAGGVTAPRGTSTTAVAAATPDGKGPRTPTPGEPDRSRPAGVGEAEWRCPWPAEADAAQIDEQAVILRVSVRADGTARTARLVADPGHGFGRAAVACALATRFAPARDRRGQPIDAESPPIRVRFTR